MKSLEADRWAGYLSDFFNIFLHRNPLCAILSSLYSNNCRRVFKCRWTQCEFSLLHWSLPITFTRALIENRSRFYIDLDKHLTNTSQVFGLRLSLIVRKLSRDLSRAASYKVACSRSYWSAAIQTISASCDSVHTCSLPRAHWKFYPSLIYRLIVSHFWTVRLSKTTLWDLDVDQVRLLLI